MLWWFKTYQSRINQFLHPAQRFDNFKLIKFKISAKLLSSSLPVSPSWVLCAPGTSLYYLVPKHLWTTWSRPEQSHPLSEACSLDGTDNRRQYSGFPQLCLSEIPWLFHDFSMTFPWVSMPFSMTISHVWNVKYTKNVAITTTRALTHLHFMYEIEAFNIEINEIVLAWTFLSEQTSKSWNVIKNIYCKI